MTGPQLPDFTPLPKPADAPSTVPIDAAIAQVVADPARLGLAWQLRQATIVSLDPTITAQIVGDTKPITVYSMIGDVFIGQMVYVITVPPGGNFICGSPNGIGIPFRDRRIITSATSSVTFSVLPIYRKVLISWTARATNAVTVQNILMQINGDVTFAYAYELIQANAATIGAAATFSAGSAVAGVLTGASAPSTAFGSGTINIQGWDAIHNNHLGYNASSQAEGSGAIFLKNEVGGFYNGGRPYTSITLFPAAGSFDAGSDFQLYAEQA
jgi:hypothetical protein